MISLLRVLPIIIFAYTVLFPIQKISDRNLRLIITIPLVALFLFSMFILNFGNKYSLVDKYNIPEIILSEKKDTVLADTGKIVPMIIIHCETIISPNYKLVYSSMLKKYGIRTNSSIGYLYLQDWGSFGFNKFTYDEKYGWYSDSCEAKDLLYRYFEKLKREKQNDSAQKKCIKEI